MPDEKVIEIINKINSPDFDGVLDLSCFDAELGYDISYFNGEQLKEIIAAVVTRQRALLKASSGESKGEDKQQNHRPEGVFNLKLTLADFKGSTQGNHLETRALVEFFKSNAVSMGITDGLASLANLASNSLVSVKISFIEPNNLREFIEAVQNQTHVTELIVHQSVNDCLCLRKLNDWIVKINPALLTCKVSAMLTKYNSNTIFNLSPVFLRYLVVKIRFSSLQDDEEMCSSELTNSFCEANKSVKKVEIYFFAYDINTPDKLKLIRQLKSLPSLNIRASYPIDHPGLPVFLQCLPVEICPALYIQIESPFKDYTKAERNLLLHLGNKRKLLSILIDYGFELETSNYPILASLFFNTLLEKIELTNRRHPGDNLAQDFCNWLCAQNKNIVSHARANSSEQPPIRWTEEHEKLALELIPLIQIVLNFTFGGRVRIDVARGMKSFFPVSSKKDRVLAACDEFLIVLRRRFLEGSIDPETGVRRELSKNTIIRIVEEHLRRLAVIKDDRDRLKTSPHENIPKHWNEPFDIYLKNLETFCEQFKKAVEESQQATPSAVLSFASNLPDSNVLAEIKNPVLEKDNQTADLIRKIKSDNFDGELKITTDVKKTIDAVVERQQVLLNSKEIKSEDRLKKGVFNLKLYLEESARFTNPWASRENVLSLADGLTSLSHLAPDSIMSVRINSVVPHTLLSFIEQVANQRKIRHLIIEQPIYDSRCLQQLNDWVVRINRTLRRCEVSTMLINYNRDTIFNLSPVFLKYLQVKILISESIPKICPPQLAAEFEALLKTDKFLETNIGVIRAELVFFYPQKSVLTKVLDLYARNSRLRITLQVFLDHAMALAENWENRSELPSNIDHICLNLMGSPIPRTLLLLPRLIRQLKRLPSLSVTAGCNINHPGLQILSEHPFFKGCQSIYIDSQLNAVGAKNLAVLMKHQNFPLRVNINVPVLVVNNFNVDISYLLSYLLLNTSSSTILHLYSDKEGIIINQLQALCNWLWKENNRYNATNEKAQNNALVQSWWRANRKNFFTTSLQSSGSGLSYASLKYYLGDQWTETDEKTALNLLKLVPLINAVLCFGIKLNFFPVSGEIVNSDVNDTKSPLYVEYHRFLTELKRCLIRIKIRGEISIMPISKLIEEHLQNVQRCGPISLGIQDLYLDGLKEVSRQIQEDELRQANPNQQARQPEPLDRNDRNLIEFEAKMRHATPSLK